MTIITTAYVANLADYPLGAVFTDKQGDVWMITRQSGTCLTSPETRELTAGTVLKKWGPLTLQWQPLQPQRAMRWPPVDTVTAYDLGVRAGRRETATDRPPADTLGYALLADAARPPSLAFAVHETAGEAEAHRVQTLNPDRWRIVALMEVPHA